MQTPRRVVYLGNLANAAAAIESIEGVRLAGWIAEEGDDIWFPDENVPPRRFATVKTVADLKRVLKSFEPYDLGVIANFGLILTEEIIASAPKGFVNVHFGLLPHRPGRHPIVQALTAGDPVVGMTLHRVMPKPDAGEKIAEKTLSTGSKRDPSEIFERMASAVPALLAERLPSLLQ